MEHTNFQEKITALLESEDLIGLGREASELRQEFEDFILEAERVEQVKRLELSEKGESYEEFDYRPLKESFFEAYKSFQVKRKKQVELKTALENENLKQKKGLIERLIKESRVPMIKHLDGNCHVYIDDNANPEMALRIVENAKTQRYGTCNTTESLLVARSVAKELLPRIGAMLKSKDVEIRGCAETQALLPGTVAATEDDWFTEYLAPIIAVKIVSGLDEAIAHINTYSSQHTEAIVTDHYGNAMRFLREVDSSSVMINASTRFADGFEYGLGAEIGISTDKIHARGPVGLEGLTSQKWVVLGHGEIRG